MAKGTKSTDSKATEPTTAQLMEQIQGLQNDLRLTHTHVQELQLEKDQRDAASGGERVKQLGPLTIDMPQAKIDKFLEADTPTVFFSSSVGNALSLVPASKRFDETMKMQVDVPGCWVSFDGWGGPGSEFPDPEDPSGQRPKYRWGVVDLARHPQVVNKTFELDMLVARMHAACKRNPKLFMPSAEIRLLMKKEYGHLESQRRVDAEYQRELSKLSEAAIAAGEPIPVEAEPAEATA